MLTKAYTYNELYWATFVKKTIVRWCDAISFYVDKLVIKQTSYYVILQTLCNCTIGYDILGLTTQG